MKKVYGKSILILILVSSLLSFHGNTYMIKSNSNTVIESNPKAAPFSANLAAWIVIAGDRDDHDKLDIIRSGTDKAYEALINRGFTASEIYYLDPPYSTFANPLSPYRDTDTTLANIQWAIETWAASLVDATHGLGLYLFDHGGASYMVLPGTDLSAPNLNTYLDNLEVSTGLNRTIIVYEASRAGSFIDPVSKDNRIVVTATDIIHSSYVNAAWDWTVFSETFWSSITQCKTIGEAFEDAVVNVAAMGYGSSQFPLIDDNHDEIGHEVDGAGNLPNGGDGTDALNVWIGTGSNCPSIYVQLWPLRYYIAKLSPIPIPIWTVITTNSLVKNVYARVIPPDWIPPTPEPEDPKLPDGVKLQGDEGVLLIQLYDRDGDGNFTPNLNPDSDFWGDDGDYQVNLIALTQDNVIAKIVSSVITVNEDGNPPPDITPPTVMITTPSPNALISGIVGVIAEGDDDQALSTIKIFVDDVEVMEEIMPSYLPYPEVTYLLDTSEYSEGSHTIRAIATDTSGNVNSDSVDITIGGEGGIPGYSITTLIFGSIIGVVMIYFISKKKIKTLS